MGGAGGGADFWECYCSGERLLLPGAGRILPGMFRELCHGHFPPWNCLGGRAGSAQDGLWQFLGFFLLLDGDYLTPNVLQEIWGDRAQG